MREANVNIRPWEMTDAPDLAAVMNNRKVQDNLTDGFPFPYTVKDAEEFIGQVHLAERDRAFIFAITYDGRAVGSIGAIRQENIYRLTARLGYYIGEEYWGRGICTAAVTLLCQYIFDHTDICRIWADPFIYNAASCRVLEKAGFLCEGTLRSNAIKNGKVLDMRLYAILK